VFNEGAEVLSALRLVPQGRQQVRLSHSEPTVEVDPRLHVWRFLTREEPLGGAGRRGSEVAHGGHGRTLRWVVAVGPIALEGRRLKLTRGRQVGDHLCAGKLGTAIEDARGCPALVSSHVWPFLSEPRVTHSHWPCNGHAEGIQSKQWVSSSLTRHIPAETARRRVHRRSKMTIEADSSAKFAEYAHPERLVSTEWLA